MNAANFRRVEKLARTGVLIAEAGAHALNTLLEANNLNGNIATVLSVDIATGITQTNLRADSLSLRVEAIVDGPASRAHRITVWISVNEGSTLEFDVS